VPKVFVEDHEQRFCLRKADGADCSIEDVLVKQTKTHYTLRLTAAQADELMSDAEYYMNGECEMLGLRSSARATVNALLKQGVAAVKPIKFKY
jgi:hypothetical protein